jgi:hypothetical protein
MPAWVKASAGEAKVTIVSAFFDVPEVPEVHEFTETRELVNFWNF